MNLEVLHRIPPRALYPAMAIGVVLMLLASYLYIFKGTLAQHARFKANRELLEAKVDSSSELTRDIETTQKAVDQLTRKLQGEGPPLPVSEMVAHTVQRLDQLSADRSIDLRSVKPGEPSRVLMFEMIPFDIEVSGGYFALYSWLHQVEKELGPMVVKNFELSPQRGAKELNMKLNMVSYRPMREGK